jgi:cytochrome c-type biogenesis protein CcmH/NrfG
MYTLYALLTLMLISALGLVLLPLNSNQDSIVLLQGKLTIICLTALFSFTLYQSSTQTKALNDWFNQGKKHYNVLVQYEALGGTDGMITKIKQKLAAHPADAVGWTILGKLYWMKHDTQAAQQAWSKAKKLTPSAALNAQ